MKFCPYCGAEFITEGAQFCAECGKEMPAKKEKIKTRDSEKTEEPLQEYRSRKKPAVKEKEAGEKRQKDKNKPADSFEEKLDVLRKALQSHSNRVVRKALMEVVPTYHTPEEVNERAIEAEEMRIAAGA